MNWDQLTGRWEEVKGRVREKWGNLTDDDLDQIQGRRQQFLGALRARYGDEKESLSRELDAFVDSLREDKP